MAASSRGDRPQASRATSLGMQKFVKGDVAGSLAEFDRALQLDSSMRPYLWQRGLSLYYLKEFEEGAKQFRDDVAVNPNDTEESIWCYLCEAQLYGPEEARKRFLKVGVDSRPVLRAAQEVFQTGRGVEKLEEMARADPNGHQGFYANLYIALFHESEKDADEAQRAMIRAVKTVYGTKSGDYMAKLAAVHCQIRGWTL
ncbi:hypothetical protein KFL_003000140 [Klebsormidium nitens]|uniref:Uncharacterized protein n=1 Tax=Klebsormidium nitens TaxID=105231 RepID=A0A1Y1IC02_KLENI|nr:hypothetical protein KFL_003000140 [Klebsormidium nitens]|eukprot:GAQ86621.1 hypothetical protein KFL_003000140 [Klebsormidium nitens]